MDEEQQQAGQIEQDSGTAEDSLQLEEAGVSLQNFQLPLNGDSEGGKEQYLFPQGVQQQSPTVEGMDGPNNVVEEADFTMASATSLAVSYVTAADETQLQMSPTVESTTTDVKEEESASPEPVNLEQTEMRSGGPATGEGELEAEPAATRPNDEGEVVSDDEHHQSQQQRGQKRTNSGEYKGEGGPDSKKCALEKLRSMRFGAGRDPFNELSL